MSPICVIYPRGFVTESGKLIDAIPKNIMLEMTSEKKKKKTFDGKCESLFYGGVIHR